MTRYSDTTAAAGTWRPPARARIKHSICRHVSACPSGWQAAGSKADHDSRDGDEFGYAATEDKKSINDGHASRLHLLGLDHEKLTYFHNGRHMRLTDVSGNVIRDIVA
jgi:hypothetical protein